MKTSRAQITWQWNKFWRNSVWISWVFCFLLNYNNSLSTEISVVQAQLRSPRPAATSPSHQSRHPSFGWPGAQTLVFASPEPWLQAVVPVTTCYYLISGGFNEFYVSNFFFEYTFLSFRYILRWFLIECDEEWPRKTFLSDILQILIVDLSCAPSHGLSPRLGPAWAFWGLRLGLEILKPAAGLGRALPGPHNTNRNCSHSLH